MRQVVLDTETTGLEPEAGHRIIEIGCVELVNRRVTQNSFHRYINPQRAIDEAAREVHGIADEFLVSKPLFVEIADEFLEFVDGARTERIANLRTIERDSHGALIHSTVIGHVLEVETRNGFPALWIEKF